MGVCGFLSNLISHLAPIGLAFDIAGAALMVGHRLPYVRRLGFLVSETHRRRRDAFRWLREGDEVNAGTSEFTALRSQLYPQDFVEAAMQFGGNVQYDRFSRDGDQIVLHVDEVGTNVPSGFNGHNLKREMSQVDESLERSYEQLFLYMGIALLMFGFGLQLYANMFLPN